LRIKKETVRLGSQLSLLFFAVVSCGVTLTLGQEDEILKGSPIYWALIISAMVPILSSVHRWVGSLVMESSWVPLFFLMAAGWAAIIGDLEILLPLLFMSLSWIYSQCAAAHITSRAFAILFVALVFLGLAIKAFSDSNYYGVLPWMVTDPLANGRVSFAGNIGFAGMLSLLAFMVLVVSKDRSPIMVMALFLAVYFVVFSRVRTAMIGVVLFSVTYWLIRMKARPSASYLFFLAIIGTSIAIFAISFAPLVLERIGSSGVTAMYLLQGRDGLDADDIREQLYRPLLWAAQVQVFFSSPFLMGWGSATTAMVETASANFLQGGDTVSFPTRLLSHYGLPALLFFYAALRALWRYSRKGDIASVCAWPVCVLVLLSWGSIFNPTSAVGTFFLILLFRGDSAFK
jgi:hypothetical protein